MKLLRALIFISGVFAVFFTTACSNQQPQVTDQNYITLEIRKAERNQLVENPQTWHVTNGKVLVLLGYGFNDQKTSDSLLELLEKKYGLDENGGMIYPLIYPESFRHGTRGYVNDFFMELENEDKQFEAIVLLGAPERTHIAMARWQDAWKNQIPCSVAALFPQDDDLGIEATCDFVIDKVQVADMTGAITEDSNVYSLAEVESVLCDTIDYLLCLNGPVEKNGNLQLHVKQLLKDRKFHRYTDPETGLQSINHFVLY